MLASEMIAKLTALIAQHGDLPITGGVLHDDTPPTKITPLDEAGISCGGFGGGRATQFFIEAS